MAASESNETRSRELELIAKHCSRVPLEPARTFHEALQSILFCQLAIHLESNGHSIGLSRIDRILWPLLSADLDSGMIDESKALELLQCMFIKLTEQDKLMNEKVSTQYAGHSMFQSLTLGGVDEKGQDACNPVTMLLLKAQESVAMHQPSLTFRYHPDTPSEVMEQLVRTIARGTGMPSLFNDATCRLILESWGVPAEESWDYAIEGCIKPSIAGKNGENFDIGWINLPKCLELAMHGGIDPKTKRQLGAKTKGIDKMNSFEDVLDAYREQVRYFMGMLADAHNHLERTHARYCPTALLSAFVPSCLRDGQPLEAGGAEYNHSGLFVVGMACTADSLAAISKEVYNEKNIALPELVKALDSNFEGQEVLRQRLKNQSPKYGNDEPEVDELSAWCMSSANEDAAVLPVMDYKDGKVRAGSLTVALHVGMGLYVGATPDGRLAGEPLSDGGISPMYGRDVKGPTAVLRSVSHLDHSKLDGTLLNLKFSPSALAGENGRKNMEGFIRTFGELGVQHVQFNVVDADTLRAAQKQPGMYENLVVRVAGYSARFVELGKNVQDDIIMRTEHVF
jgi:formate C-acetyltransferase